MIYNRIWNFSKAEFLEISLYWIAFSGTVTSLIFLWPFRDHALNQTKVIAENPNQAKISAKIKIFAYKHGQFILRHKFTYTIMYQTAISTIIVT